MKPNAGMSMLEPCVLGSRMSESRDELLQAVLDKLWSSALEFSDDTGPATGNPTPAARERWQRYAEQLLLRVVEHRQREAAK